MNLLSALDKLIKEHGSASILKDHLALFKDQVVLLENQNSSLMKENASLKEQINKLCENEKLLKSKIEEYDSQLHGTSCGINDEEIELMKLISSGLHTIEDLTKSANIGREVIRYHLAELVEKNHLVKSSVPMVGQWWELEQPGRRYLIENNHIS